MKILGCVIFAMNRVLLATDFHTLENGTQLGNAPAMIDHVSWLVSFERPCSKYHS